MEAWREQHCGDSAGPGERVNLPQRLQQASAESLMMLVHTLPLLVGDRLRSFVNPLIIDYFRDYRNSGESGAPELLWIS